MSTTKKFRYPSRKNVKKCLLNEYKNIKTKKDFEKAVDKCTRAKTAAKKVEYKPVRHRAAEEPERHLIRWYEDSKTGAIASFWDEPGNAHMRVSTPTGSDEIGFPFANLRNQSEEWFKKTAVKFWKMI